MIFDRYKMRNTAIDMKNVLKGEDDHSVTYRLALVAGEGTFITAVIWFVFRIIISPFSFLTLLSLLLLVGYLVTYFIVGIITQETDGEYSRIVAGIGFILVLPVIWIYSGGFAGAGPVWFIFGAILLCASISLKNYIKVLPLYIVVFIGTIIITERYPELIRNESAFVSKANIIASICISAFFYSIIFILHRFISEIDRKKVTQLQKELSDSNDELSASNEELMASNEELLEVTQKLQEAMDKQKMFSASMTHELRTPLNGVEGSLQMMLLSGTLDEDNTISIENALNACRNLSRNVNDMLDFAKLSEGKFEIVKKEFDLRNVVNDIRYLFDEQARAKGIKFTINVPGSTKCSLVGDDVRIAQVLTNLISNSVKYTQEGSVCCDFNVSDNKLNFSISDTGIGMSKESIEVLFDPFTRFDLKKNSGIQGTGLGMSIVYNLIKEMDGEISVQSEVGKGTRFDVVIPIAINDASVVYGDAGADDLSMNKKDTFETADFSNVDILCVDDTKMNLVVFKGLLKQTNARIDIADNGVQALKMLATKKYDIVFVDHFMPQKDGIELYKDLRGGDGINKDTPVIMLTGNTTDEYIKLYESEGFAGWLLKPVEQKKLVNIIEKHLDTNSEI